MNKSQKVILKIGLVIFLVVGIGFEIERSGHFKWPSFNDVLLILFLIGIAVGGLCWQATDWPDDTIDRLMHWLTGKNNPHRRRHKSDNEPKDEQKQ